MQQARDGEVEGVGGAPRDDGGARGCGQALADRAAGWLFWYALGAAVLTAVVWTLLGASGMFAAVDDILTRFLASPSDPTPVRMEDFVNTNRLMSVTALFCVVNVIILTALGTIFAFLYNLSANILGGLELTLAED